MEDKIIKNNKKKMLVIQIQIKKLFNKILVKDIDIIHKVGVLLIIFMIVVNMFQNMEVEMKKEFKIKIHNVFGHKKI